MKIGYVRVSTVEQSETDALEQQTARVKRSGAVLVFLDVESGRKDSRVEFNKMLELCRQGGVTEVIITRIDRLARSVVTAHQVLREFEELGIKLNILDAPIDDTSSPFGWFSASQMSQLAEFESRLLSSRIKHGMDYFRQQKKAAPQPGYGYKRIDEKYAPDPQTWEKAIAIINFFLSSNGTLRSTAHYSLTQFGKRWTLPGLRYWMTNPVLRGHTVYGRHGNMNHPQRWEVHYNTHTPLICEDTYQAVERKLAENRTRFAYGNNKDGRAPLPLQGQLICGCCGYKCYIKKTKFKPIKIRCKQHDTQGDAFCSNAKSTYLADVMGSVDEALTHRREELALMASTAIENDQQTPEIIELTQQLKNLQSMPQTAIIQEAIAQTKAELERSRQVIVRDAAVNDELVAKLMSTFARKGYWDELPETEKRRIYLELVEQVVVVNGEILSVFLRV